MVFLGMFTDMKFPECCRIICNSVAKYRVAFDGNRIRLNLVVVSRMSVPSLGS